MIVKTSLLLLLAACSHITYEAHLDGSTKAEGWEFGTTQALEGARFETRADGSRLLKLDGYNADRVEGMKQINEGLSLIVEGAAKGVK
jgi:hypothetical protein